MIFYVGCHQPSDAHRFQYACVSVNRLRDRKSGFRANRWLLDSGAFTELSTFGHYRDSVSDYARHARRWAANPTCDAVVAQDYMCEPFIIAKTGLSVTAHQWRTIDRYSELTDLLRDVDVPVLPVLQGYTPAEYVAHVAMYGDDLEEGAWVGVGSVCKRQSDPAVIVNVLYAIHQARPDLRLHGFGVKSTALAHPGVRDLLWSADSMAWSYAARKQGRNGNDWREGEAFRVAIDSHLPAPWQPPLMVV